MLQACPMVDFKELRYTRKLLKKSDLVGIWEPTEETRQFILKSGKYENKIIQIKLGDNDSIEILNIPDWWKDGFGQSHGKFETILGSWKLELDTSMRFLPVCKISISTNNYVTSFNMYRQTPPYGIFIGVGDPNDGKAMIYEKTLEIYKNEKP